VAETGDTARSVDLDSVRFVHLLDALGTQIRENKDRVNMNSLGNPPQFFYRGENSLHNAYRMIDTKDSEALQRIFSIRLSLAMHLEFVNLNDRAPWIA